MRASAIVTMWLLLLGSIRDALLAGGRSPSRLLLLYLAVTALTAVALWVELADRPATGRGAPGGGASGTMER
jgi:hypothetical protein